MSVGNGPAGFGQPDTGSGAVETAKHEASAVKDTATDAAKDVVHTARGEASAVAGEAKTQLKDLFVQSRNEFSDQAANQQARIAAGLKSVGDELGSMARNSDGQGIATDLVQQVSTRLSGAANWLGEREPAAVLDEVKRFARRRPVVFIAGAALAGIVAGRLVRALAANQHDGGDSSASGTRSPAVPEATPALSGGSAAPAAAAAVPGGVVAAGTPASPATGVGAGEETPLYNESAATFDQTYREDRDDRSDTV
jgi:hypothetical protein